MTSTEESSGNNRDGVKVEGKDLMNEISQDSAAPNLAGAETQPAPKLLEQGHVNVLVGKAKQEGREKGRQEALAELSAQQPAQAQSQSIASNDPASARQIFQEEFAKQTQAWERQAQEQAANQQAMKTLSEVNMKFNDAKTRYHDFDNVVNLKYFQQMPDVLHLANSVDNTGDVVYDLLKNPGKIAQLRGIPEDLARQQMRNLSDSIKQNQTAISNPQTPEPLSQIKPSTIGLDNGSKKSVSDLRNTPSYRG